MKINHTKIFLLEYLQQRKLLTRQPTTCTNVYIEVFKVCHCLLSKFSIGTLQGKATIYVTIEHYPNMDMD